MKLMKQNQLVIVIEALLELTNVGEWECRHGAYLGLKYLLCAVNLDRDIIVQLIYPRVFNGLKDGVDDVVSEAAGALLPVVKQFIDRLVSSLFPFLNYEDTNQNQNMNLKYTYFIKVFKNRGPYYFENSRKCFPCPPDQMTNF